MALEDHSNLIFQILGFIGLVGGVVSVTFGKLISTLRGDMKTKVSTQHCDDLHKAINGKLDRIEKVTEKNLDKMEGMNNTLVRIETILNVQTQNATDRYDRHSEKYKDE